MQSSSVIFSVFFVGVENFEKKNNLGSVKKVGQSHGSYATPQTTKELAFVAADDFMIFCPPPPPPYNYEAESDYKLKP